MRVRINPYKSGSRSAKLLSQTTGWLRLREQSRFRPRADDVVINWGDSACPSFPCRVLNPARSIMNASNKLTAFRLMKEAGVSIPEVWTSYEELPEDADYKFVGRSVLSGHSGEGISIGKRGDVSLCRTAPLYTRYIPKRDEYRVHVAGGSVLFVQRKARRTDCENPNWAVRNLAGGFVFVAADQAALDGSAQRSAVGAVAALGLDFGAADIVVGRLDGLSYCLEVNTACGLEQRTADKYAAALKEMTCAVTSATTN